MLVTSRFFNSSCSSASFKYIFSISVIAFLFGISILNTDLEIGANILMLILPIGNNFSIYHESSSGNFNNANVSPVGAQSTIILSYFSLIYISAIFNNENNSSIPGIIPISCILHSSSDKIFPK